MKRRAVIAGVPTALFLGGCTDLVTEGEARFEADQPDVEQAALDNTGYDQERVEEQEITEEFADRQVVVVNVMAEYKRQVDLEPIASGELARFTVLSTPQVNVAGRSFNPIDDMDNDELAEMLQQEYEEIDDVELVDERTLEFLGSEEEVSLFEATAVLTGGEEVDVFIHIAQTDSEEDFIVAMAVHPQDIDEQGNVDRLIQGVIHPA